jgi:hypothetical protein
MNLAQARVSSHHRRTSPSYSRAYAAILLTPGVSAPRPPRLPHTINLAPRLCRFPTQPTDRLPRGNSHGVACRTPSKRINESRVAVRETDGVFRNHPHPLIEATRP